MIDDDIGIEIEDFSELYNNPSREGLLSGMEKFVSDLGPA
jgi:hypothetical protein